MRRAKKKRLARAFAVITAVSLLALFIVRDVVRENLKDLHDSLGQAEAQFRIIQEQAAIASRTQQQDIYRTYMSEFVAHPGLPDLGRLPDMALAQAWEDFDSASDLIDALPSDAIDLRKLRDNVAHDYVAEVDDQLSRGKTDLRKMRDESRSQLDQLAKELVPQNSSGPLDPHGVMRDQLRMRVLDAAVVQQGELANLGDLALVSARHVQQRRERRISICSYLIYILGVVVAALGIYAAIVLKPEGNEPSR